MDAVWLRLVLAVLATWRLATLLARDDGPWEVVARLRAALGDGQLGRLLDCFRCVSLAVAAPLALAVGRDALECLLAWPALSGAACLIERWHTPPAPALTIESWNEQGDSDELLRKQPGEPGDSPGELADDAAESIRGDTSPRP
jgi:hypothetical protein